LISKDYLQKLARILGVLIILGLLVAVVGYLLLGLKQRQEIAALPSLSVQTDPPGASILLDGNPPQLPNTFTHVPFGTHQLTVTLKPYEPIKQDIKVHRGMTPQIYLQLKPIGEIAALSVQTEPPGAAILLDGKPPQAPPNSFTHVPFGTHQLTATLDGYGSITQDIEVRPGMAPEIRLELQAESVISQLPTFFPPKATDTVELHIIPDLKNLTLQQASDEISRAMDDAGYEQRSYFWLDKDHRPGFAIITHIEQIQADGVPVRAGRWSFDLPNYGPFSIQTFLKALTSADTGNYRLIALVLSRVPFEEKKEPITQEQVGALNRGAKFLARTTDSDAIVTTDYHCIAYIYEFERKTRSDAPVFKETSDVSATDHLKSTGLFINLTKVAQYR
jgi:PEGA domain